MRSVLPAIAATALLALGLSACAAAPSGTATTKGCPAAKSGSSSAQVTVSGSSKAEPKVVIKGKLAASSTERAVVSGGTGKALKDGSTVNLSYAVYDGSTKKRLGAAGYGGQAPQAAQIDKALLPAGIYKALVCTTVGSRIVAVVPPKDQGSGAAGTAKDVVFVFDVRSIVTPLKPSAWTRNVPAVDLAANPPTVTIPNAAAPTTLQLKVLAPGSGATVKSGDSVTLDYQGTVWSTKKVFDQSFGKKPVTFVTGQVIPGFTAALVGQKVGSTVLVTIPPKDGYGPQGGQPGAGISATDTLVFLIKIQKTAGK